MGEVATTTLLLTSHEAKPAKAPSIHDAIEVYIGATGARQLLKAMLLAFAWAFDAQQVFMSVFTDAEPPWHCTGVVDAVEAAAGDSGSSCSSPATSASPCALPLGTWEWDRLAKTSVVSDWALNCSGGGPALVSLPASSFFTGNLVVVLPYSLISATTTPLLTSHEAEPSIDDVIEAYIGATGARQLLKAMLLAFAWAFDAQQVFMSVFTDAEPPWHCTGVVDAAAAAAADSGSSCSPPAASASPCALPPGTWEWDRPAETSVVSDWALNCGPALVSLPASSFFAGNLAGGFLLATLADTHLGRRKMLLLSLVTMSVAAALTAFSPNVWVYSALRFVSGFGRSMVGTSAMVLSTELDGKRWRNTVSAAGFVFFSVGFVSLPALAYTFREASWRNMYVWTSLPSLCYAVLLYLLVQESPRWLLVRGRKQEAIEAVRQIASLNGGGGGITTSSFSMLDACAVELGDGGEGMFATLHSIWERRRALRRLAAITAASFGVGMVYYGMPLNVGSLSPSNLYLSVAYNAVAELPSSILAWLLMGRWFNRRGSVVALTTASGLCSLAACVPAVVLPDGARMAAEVASFFASCTAYDMMLMYTIELFPTSVRNSAVGLVRQAVALGGVVAPVLVALGRETTSYWSSSFGVFGLAVGCLGLLVTCLPETRGRRLSDTMEEEEAAVLSSSGASDMDNNGELV
ncbi:Os01g0330500 [Oryza sativa Japonica Group]|uniref:Os01g0330500 protein n=1 Tax=Oryza sativa subsp. japonica TaxID=39947 RepID=C7IXM9_ORYSJ|nr:Os01g0330500 [Oryza sativa Japonica Group]|eukprot:NP_001172311.1 Os01g0330500 [Oryza sativa Japonica Group]